MVRQAAFEKLLKRLSRLRRPLSALYVDHAATEKGQRMNGSNGRKVRKADEQIVLTSSR